MSIRIRISTATSSPAAITRVALGLAAASAIAVTPVALASGGASATATPSHVKAGKTVQLRVTGLRPSERIKARETIPSIMQARTIFPRQRASSTGVVLVYVKAQVKGKHVWTFTGRWSHRKASTHYVVR